MSSSLKLQQATHALGAALKLAQAERDQAIFELARGQRSQRELQRLCERAALLANLLLQARALLPPPACVQSQAQAQAQCHSQPQPPPCNRRFRPGEHWQRGQVRYRVESCPLIPSWGLLKKLPARRFDSSQETGAQEARLSAMQ